MLPNGEGRYCLHSQKTVIDFSSKSDVDVARIVPEADGGVCGQLRRSQLLRPLVGVRRVATRWTMAAGLALFALCLPYTTSAQVPTRNAESSDKPVTNASQPGNVGNSTPPKSPARAGILLKGTIVSAENGYPFVGATVIESRLGIGTIADRNGDFALTYNSTLLPDTLIFTVKAQQNSMKIPIAKSDLPLTVTIALSDSEPEVSLNVHIPKTTLNPSLTKYPPPQLIDQQRRPEGRSR